MRITGMASGMDIDSMVESMLDVDRLKLEKVEREKQMLEWKQEVYTDLNKDFANFLVDTRKDLGLMTTTSTGTNLNTGMSNIDWHMSATSSDESVGTVSVSGSDTFTGSHTVKVNDLATRANLASSSDVAEDLDAASAFTFNISDGETTETISMESGETASDFVNRINESGLGVRASYDSNINRLFIESEETGGNSNITIDSVSSNDGKDFINGLNIGTIDDITTGSISKTGTDASINYDGANNITQSSNDFSINGMDFTVKSMGEFNITVREDINAAVDKISSFVAKYNEMIDKAGGLVAERDDRSYGGITKEEKEAMTEDELEKWEERAKKGALYRDTTVNNMLSDIRLSLYEGLSSPGGSFDHLTEIGISTERYSSGQTGGKLQIDEDKLREALSSDANGVMSLLFQDGEVEGTGDTKTDSRGIFNRISDRMIDGMKDLIDRSGTGGNDQLFKRVRSNMLTDFVIGSSPLVRQGSVSMMDRNMLDLDSRLAELNTWLLDRENSYYSRFTAMEKAMQDMASQSGWLMNQGMGM